MHLGDEPREVLPGDAVYIPPDTVQYIDALGAEELVFLCIVDPAWRAEDESVG
jgi:mannose-6-phosphate isomerase-like protein (cupin superfamily)